tara:strand:- start:64 stop:399 length:336 start_codon:yes stop_codon:yes gene_type:complete
MGETLQPTNFWTSNKKRVYKYMGRIKSMHGKVSEMGITMQTGKNQYQNIPTVIGNKTYIDDMKGLKKQIRLGNVKFNSKKFKTEKEAGKASFKNSQNLKIYHGNPWEHKKT